MPKTTQQLQAELEAAQQRIAEIEQQQAMTQKIVDNIPLLIMIHDREGRYALVNQAAAAGVGYTPAEMVGKKEEDFFPPETVAQFQASAQQVRTTGEKVEEEGKVELEDGEHTYLTTRFPLFDPAGEVMAIVTVAEDITAQLEHDRLLQKLEEQTRASQESQAMLQGFMDNAPILMLVQDDTGKYMAASPAAAAALGKEPHELIGKTDYDFFDAETADFFLESIHQIIASGEPVTREDHTPVGDEIRVYMTTRFPIQNAAGEYYAVGTVAIDITEKQEFITAVSRLKAVVDSTNDFVSSSDLEGNVLYINPKGLQMVGLEGVDPTTTQISDYHSPEWTKTIGEQYMPVVMQEGIWSGELEMQHADGTPVPVSGVITLVKDEQGEPIGLGAIYRDIRERKQAEAERERLQQEIIETQQRALKELSTPVIPVMEGILVMPLVGSIDSLRAKDIMRTLLEGIRQHRAHVVILDITGVPIVDSGVASHLDKTIQAARLKGARTIITGISDAVAEAVVDLGINWRDLETLRDLQTGLRVALSSIGMQLSQK